MLVKMLDLQEMAVLVAEAAVVAVSKTLTQEMVALVSFTSTIKMYAVVDKGFVVSPFVGTTEQLTKAKEDYPSYEFIEMTLENSPLSIGDKI
jgi:hypothetical protein